MRFDGFYSFSVDVVLSYCMFDFTKGASEACKDVNMEVRRA